MVTIDFFNEFKIKKCNNCVPTSITWINQHYYVCYANACCILCFDATFSCCNYIYVNGNYAAICYDVIQNCYYAIDQSYTDQIIVLDRNFQEIDQIAIFHAGSLAPTSIVCDENTILIAISSEIIMIDIVHPEKQTVLQHVENITALDVQSSNIYVASQNDQYNTLFMYNEYGEQLDQMQLPCDLCIYGMALQDSALFILAEEFDHQFKVFEGCLCQDMENLSDSCCSTNSCCSECEQSCMFQKIADIEGSIACILDAEGRKIQYAIQTNATIAELLEINHSVQMTIQQIIQLEFTLFSKLSLCLCDADENDCGTASLFEQCSEI